ncbi:MAG: beta-ketoacyl-[acyl-carrier-protein] synthase family protein [Deltaproteobacteria bacterium]|nr:beta-ketoacyl-[acyl-carrier-protein] synthase family protein [Deltaproteobacteria bacterium]
MRRRVVITGMGAVTPLGSNLKTTWDNLMKAKSGIDHISLFDASSFPVKIAAEVKDFDESSIEVPEELENFTGRATKFCLSATQEAIENACLDLDTIDPTMLGISMGGNEETSKFSDLTDAYKVDNILDSMNRQDLSYFNNSNYLGQIWAVRRGAHTTSNILSILYNAQGPVSTSSTACASSTQAIGKAMRVIEHGDADIMITGGCDSIITEFSVAGFGLLGALSQNNDTPERASRPFDLKRDGFVLGEGTGIFIMEELSHALKRGAKIHAEITGFGTSSNAYRITDSPPDGRGPDHSMRSALQDAGLSPEDIDYINAHGTSTLVNDRSETQAIKKVFGEAAYGMPISSNKSMLGHLIASAGAIELIVSVLTIQKSIIPPTINYEMPDPDCDLDYVPNEPRKHEVNAVLSNSFAFGGQNASLVVEGYPE